MSDFCLVSRRVLSDDDYRIFKFHYLLGADWKLCCQRLGLDRGTFYHQVYRIQERLGRVYKELEPYGLFPLDEYFNGHKTEMIAVVAGFELTDDKQPKIKQLRYPVKRAA